MSKMLTATILAFAFSGCATKTETVIYVPCVLINPIKQPHVRTIRVYKEDENVTKAYIKEFRAKIDAQNKITNAANELCKEWRK